MNEKLPRSLVNRKKLDFLFSVFFDILFLKRDNQKKGRETINHEVSWNAWIKVSL